MQSVACLLLKTSWNVMQAIIESLRLEETSKIPKSNPSPPHRAHCPRPSVPHPHGSGTPPGTVTPPLPGQLCHCLTALWEKELFLTANLNLPWHNVRPSPLVLRLFPGSRGRPHLTQPPFRSLQRARRSPLSLLFSRQNSPASLSRSPSHCAPEPSQLRCPSLDTLQALSVFLAVRAQH